MCACSLSILVVVFYLFFWYHMIIDSLLCLWLQEDILKIDNWQYINCINLWVRFICVNYKDCNNVHSLLSAVVQIIRGVAYLLPGMRYIPLRLKLAQMLNELSNCNQMFFPVPSLIFGCLEFREIFQKEQTEKTNIRFSSLLKVLHFYLAHIAQLQYLEFLHSFIFVRGHRNVRYYSVDFSFLNLSYYSVWLYILLSSS
jgi:hypothetical protein